MKQADIRATTKTATEKFSKLYHEFALSNLEGTTCSLYMKLLALADFKTFTVQVYIATLASLINRSMWTVRRHLHILISMGLIERVFNKSPHNPKMNLANTFILRRPSELKNYASITAESIPANERLYRKMSGGTHIFVPQENLDVERESIRDNLIGEAELPISYSTYPEDEGQDTQVEQVAKEKVDLETAPKAPEATPKAEDPIQPELDLSEVPYILKPTARNLLTLSGRTTFYKDEVAIMVKLLERHYPARINCQIEESAAYFKRVGRNLKGLTMYYIASILKKQRSYDPNAEHTSTPKRSPLNKNKKAAKRNPAKPVVQVIEFDPLAASRAEHVAEPETTELTMPVAEAGKVIAEYKPVQKKEEAAIPAALVELHEALREEQAELDKRNARKSEDAETEQLAVEDYLRLKFPETDEDDLTAMLSSCDRSTQKDIETAFKADLACACCTNPEGCTLPNGVAKGRARPNVAVKDADWGGRVLRTGWGGCLKCKHTRDAQEKSIDPEFERRVKASGLTQYQAGQTFEAHQHEGTSSEVIVAKAQAMIAAKTQRNLVLAGKAGTGKTHLAIAIAIDAMRNGRQAIVASVAEMLEEIKAANVEHKDAFGLMMKYKSVSCLVLDDLGKERATDTTMSYLFEIVDYRYRHGLQTIVTTNKTTAEALETRWNKDAIQPIASRLLENGEWVVINHAEDYRSKKAALHARE